MKEITYTMQGDYLIPDLSLPEQQEVTLGKWAQMKKEYLKQHHKIANIHGEISEYVVPDELEEEDNSIPANPMILIVSVTGGTYMNITTRITKLDNPESKLKALATVVLNGNFAVGGIKVIGTEKGMYVAMPNHLGKDNQYYDDCYPVTAEMRKAINTAVMTAYENNDTAVIKSEPEAIAMKVKVLPNNNHDSNLKGFAQITMDDCFVVSGVKVFDGANGMFLQMPQYKNSAGEYKNIANPVTKEFHDELNNKVIDAFKNAVTATNNQQEAKVASTAIKR